MNVRRAALLFVLLSLVGWELWEGLRPFSHPWSDLDNGMYTDHISHMNCARLFPLVGFDLLRKPVDQMFRPLTDAEIARLPVDARSGGSWSGGTYLVPGWPKDKPLVMGWSHEGRVYPVGDMLLVAPIAALYHFTPISFHWTARLLIMFFIFGAHLALWIIIGGSVRPPVRSPILWWLSFALLYVFLTVWAANGFFDVFVVAALALSAHYIGERKPLPALVAYCAAALMHFRAYFFAPLAVQAAIWLIQDRAWRHFKLRQWVGFALAVAMGLTSLYSFKLTLPIFNARPALNPLNLGDSKPIALYGFLLAISYAMWLLRHERAYFDMVVCGWLTVMMLTYRFAYPWHPLLAVMPWLFSRCRARPNGRRSSGR